MDWKHFQDIGLPVVAPGGAAAPAPSAAKVTAQAQVTKGGGSRPTPAASAGGAASAPKPEKLSTTALAAVVRHGEVLPDFLAQRIPASDARILSFLLRFLKDGGLDYAPIFINGGYVRDLLLGKEPDDLDLSVCLRESPEGVTVSGLMEQLPGYATSHPDLGIAEVKVATILSNESKDKQLDTFKAHFLDFDGKKIEVDVMPTIGEETYTDESRTPIRDQRGTAEQDTLRRDLTIGALLLKVLPVASPEGLRYELFDYYGGVDDLKEGVLRSPFPLDKELDEVRGIVLRGQEDRDLAEALGLSAVPKIEAIQALWWAKVLIDDPLRICRALRFQAKLRFAMHDAFWLAAPFALEHLRGKVAGGRKNTEYIKMGGYGFKACASFYEQAFAKTFGPKNDIRLAVALFGGQDEKSRPKVMTDVEAFDVEGFQAVASTMAGVSHDAELIGGLLAVAISCAKMGAGAGSAVDEFNRACDGMCVSNATREAGATVLNSAAKLAEPVPPAGTLERGFAAAIGASEATVCRLVQVWEAMCLCQARSGQADATSRRQHTALKVFERNAALAGVDAEEVRASFATLQFERPPIKGNALGTPGVLEVPPMLRRQVMVLLDVSLRYVSSAEPLETAADVEALFARLPALRDALSSSVWFEEDGKTLRAEFKPAKKGKK